MTSRVEFGRRRPVETNKIAPAPVEMDAEGDVGNPIAFLPWHWLKSWKFWTVIAFIMIYIIGRNAPSPPVVAAGPQIVTPGFDSFYAPIASDPRTNYLVLDIKKKGGGIVEMISRRDGRETTFARREIDCVNGRFRYLSEGDSLAALAKLLPNSSMGALTDGSISTEMSRVACGYVGLRLMGVRD